MIINEKEIKFNKLPYTKLAGVKRFLAPIFDAIFKGTKLAKGKINSKRLIENFTNLSEEQVSGLVDSFAIAISSIDGKKVNSDDIDLFLVDCSALDFVGLIQTIFIWDSIDFDDKKK